MSAAAARLRRAAAGLRRAARALRGAAPRPSLRLAAFAAPRRLRRPATGPRSSPTRRSFRMAAGGARRHRRRGRAAGSAAARACRGPRSTLAALGVPSPARRWRSRRRDCRCACSRPGAWDELGAELDRGPVRASARWTGPTAGDDDWVRLVILLAAPAAARAGGGAGVLARAAGPRGRCARSGLVALLALYGTAVTEHDPGAPLLRGLVLFLLVAAWLWLPRLRAREAARRRGRGAGRGRARRCPPRPGSTRDGAVVDYQSWNWFGGKDVTFDWNHSYGPLDWPREGTTLLQVKSERAALLEGRDAGPLRRPALGALDRQRPHRARRRAAARARPALGRAASG